MSLDYDEISTTARDAILEAGEETAVKRFGRANDAVEGGADLVAFIAGTVTALKVPMVGKRLKMMARILGVDLAEMRGQMFLVAALGAPFDVTVNDVFFADDDYWAVKGVNPLKPAGTTILYTVYAENAALTQADLDALALAEYEDASSHLHTLVTVDLPPVLA